MLHKINCPENTATKNSNVKRIKQNGLILLSRCAICGKKKSRFIKNLEVSELLSKSGIRGNVTPFGNVPLTGNILF